MASEANGSIDTSTSAGTASASATPLPSSPTTATTDALPIGYEAADPALQAPLWCEAILASPAPRNLR